MGILVADSSIVVGLAVMALRVIQAAVRHPRRGWPGASTGRPERRVQPYTTEVHKLVTMVRMTKIKKEDNEYSEIPRTVQPDHGDNASAGGFCQDC